MPRSGGPTLGPIGHVQTYAGVTHASSGRFDAGSGSTPTVTGTLTHRGVGPLTVIAGGTLTVAAAVVNQGFVPGGAGTANALYKAGGGDLVLAAVNFYTGPTYLEAGRLVLGSGAAVSDVAFVAFLGGTLSTAGGPAGAGVGEAVGTLTVQADSRIELGTGPHVLRFNGRPGSFGPFIDDGVRLTIRGWQGVAFASGTAGEVVLIDGSQAATGGSLGRIQFEGFPVGAALIPYTGPGGGFGLVPVPGPAAVLGLAAAGLGAVRRVRRWPEFFRQPRAS